MISLFLSRCRIVRDYEKYIARQLKRGTSRQELNISWLKKNELDLKRHVVELRESVRNNWSATGLELTRDLRQFWQNSRPGSPARSLSRGPSSPNLHADMKSPISLAHLPHLDIPRRGDSLGLIGGIRSWVSFIDQFPNTTPFALPCLRVAADDAKPDLAARERQSAGEPGHERGGERRA